MAEPSKKSPELTAFLENAFGRSTAITGNKCIPAPIGCGRPITGFRDELSKKEYLISGLCQDCQDTIFNVLEDGEE